MVFFSSNLGDASKHSVKNMPVLLAGGGFKHGQHLAFDENNNPPLCNLLRQHAPAAGHRGRQVRQHGHADGAGNGRLKPCDRRTALPGRQSLPDGPEGPSYGT